jgi:hypothetical protein
MLIERTLNRLPVGALPLDLVLGVQLFRKHAEKGRLRRRLVDCGDRSSWQIELRREVARGEEASVVEGAGRNVRFDSRTFLSLLRFASLSASAVYSRQRMPRTRKSKKSVPLRFRRRTLLMARPAARHRKTIERSLDQVTMSRSMADHRNRIFLLANGRMSDVMHALPKDAVFPRLADGPFVVVDTLSQLPSGDVLVLYGYLRTLASRLLTRRMDNIAGRLLWATTPTVVDHITLEERLPDQQSFSEARLSCVGHGWATGGPQVIHIERKDR